MKISLTTNDGEVIDIFKDVEEYFGSKATDFSKDSLWIDIKDEIENAIKRGEK